MLLAYRDEPSFFAVGRRLRAHHQTVQRCVERAAAGPGTCGKCPVFFALWFWAERRPALA